jgi:(p)ppGpp synthase/HD superfamily hydrolase
MSYDLQHGLEVARRCPDELWIVGLLHDAIEDGAASQEQLAQGLGSYMLETLVILSRTKDETYWDYIRRVATDPAARFVKIADLKANLARMDEAHESLRPRYEKALDLLGEREGKA